MFEEPQDWAGDFSEEDLKLLRLKCIAETDQEEAKNRELLQISARRLLTLLEQSPPNILLIRELAILAKRCNEYILNKI